MTLLEKPTIEYCGDIRTIESMKSELETGHASYWHWHTLLNQFYSIYRRARKQKEYGILLPETPQIGKYNTGEIEGRISQGGYDKESLFLLIEMYEFLLNEDIDWIRD